MECVVYFSELKEDYKNADNPIVTLENCEELFIGLGIFSVANEYFGKSYKFDWLSYCGLPGDKYYDLAQKYMPNVG